jgi:hypothetical protein
MRIGSVVMRESRKPFHISLAHPTPRMLEQ